MWRQAWHFLCNDPGKRRNIAMKVAVIGAGNVGGQTAIRLTESHMGEVVLIDLVKGLAQGKVCDLEDACSALKLPCTVMASEDIAAVEGADIVVVTAGLARKPGMSREELLQKNTQIISGICQVIQKKAAQARVIMVTNPLDLMTYCALKVTGFDTGRVFGMGLTLDAARFANLISQELRVPSAQVEAVVIGTHGEGMLPLSRLTTVGNEPLSRFLDSEAIAGLVKRTIDRGKEIVGLLASGSAYCGPSAAIVKMVEAVVKDEKRVLGASCYLDGAYGIRGVCIGVPCRIGKTGIEQVVEIELDTKEKEALKKSAESLRAFISQMRF
jgi:malate dehydrogenase